MGGIDMKKLATFIILAALLASPALHAEPGRGAQNGTQGGNSFGWGLGLGGLAVIGVVTGIVAASASSSPSSFNH
jgi:threonine/homoserine/homoserine lactone efflux protein